MKKIKFITIICISVIITVVIAGCGGSKASDKAVSVGKRAIEVVDEYLDGQVSYSAADIQLDELKEQMSYVDDLEHGAKNKATDFSISTSITLISSDMFQDSYKSTSETYDKLLQSRNELANKVGVKKR